MLQVGDKHGAWTVTGIERGAGRKVLYAVTCDCGRTGQIRASDVEWGKLRSCKACAKRKAKRFNAGCLGVGRG